MKNLTLSIKQIFFNQILSGEKKIETRDIRPNNMSKYCQVDEMGLAIFSDGIFLPVKYDTITFYTGAYSGKRPKMVVKVGKAEICLLEDENSEIIVLEENGEEYYPAIIEYHLEKILERP